MRSIPFLMVLALGGCGGPAPGTLDAGVDAAALDAPAADASSRERRTWVVDSLSVPTTPAEASALGRDLDGDGSVDNQLGAVLAAMMSGGAGDVQANTDVLVLHGDAIVLVEAIAGSFTAEPAAEGRALRGGSPSPAACTDPSDVTTCGRHLAGTASFDVVSPAPPRAPGAIASARLDVGPADSILPVVLDREVLWLPMVRAHVAADIGARDLSRGTLTGVIPTAAIDDVLVPGLHASIAAAIARDCPGGVCDPGSTGETLLALYDESGDGTVTLDEVRTNTLVTSLLAPDVDVDGDGTSDGLSAGIGFTAVPATFDAP